MATEFVGFVRRIDFEPKKDFLGVHTYAHIFSKPSTATGSEVDVYTDNPRFEAAFLTAYSPKGGPTIRPLIEVHYEEDKATTVRMVVRVILDIELV
jgi:hypothetical protein